MNVTPVGVIFLIIYLMPVIYVATVGKLEVRRRIGWMLAVAFTSYLGLVLYMVFYSSTTNSTKNSLDKTQLTFISLNNVIGDV